MLLFFLLLEKQVKLSVDDDILKFNTISLTNTAPDQFTDSNWWMNHIHFIGNEQEMIIAFEVNAGRTIHLRYDKMN